MTETLILVDQHDNVVGHGEKLHIHREGLLHRAFSIFIFDVKGRLLLQKRASEKYHSGGLWTNTCCGHPRMGEQTDAAAQRRLTEEMGFTCKLNLVDTFIYMSPVSNGLVEHEFDHLYVGSYSGVVVPSPHEAEEWKWIDLNSLSQWIKSRPEEFTFWFREIVANPAFLSTLKRWQAGNGNSNWSSLTSYQSTLLRGVSHTYSLAIPLLPVELVQVVTHAYLLLRIADTIEDEPALTPQQIKFYEESFVEVMRGSHDPEKFCAEVSALLTIQTAMAEHEVLSRLPLLLDFHHQLKPAFRSALTECLEIISQGMAAFRQKVGTDGLETHQELDQYCYCVSGSVGEMMTKFFIEFDPALSSQRVELLRLSVSFGAALQLTNIIKDQWEDRKRGMCWLPQDLFAVYQVNLAGLKEGQHDPRYAHALSVLVGTTHAHMKLALEYALCIPASHIGIRRFVVCTLGLALLVLRQVQRNPYFSLAQEVRPTSAELAGLMRIVNWSNLPDRALRRLFNLTCRTLPLTPLGPEWDEEYYRTRPWPRSSLSFLPGAKQ